MTAIDLLIEPRQRSVGDGTVERLLPFRRRRTVGPFVFLDRIGPEDMAPGSGIDVPAHPHIGLSTLTYLFDGQLVHRDSVGSVQTIEPGDVNWMTAGRGIAHTERSPRPERDHLTSIAGLQMWVALPTEAEESEPFFAHTPADTIPRERSGGAHVRVVAGQGFGMDSPVPVSSPLVLAELRLDDGASVTIEREMPERALLALDGSVTVDGAELPTGHLAVLAADEAPRLEGQGTVVMIGGEPLGPRHIWWNFVHSDRDRIEEAKQRWREQGFPLVPDDHDGWVPLPE